LKTLPGIGRAAPGAPSKHVQPEQNTKLHRGYLNEPDFAVSRPRGKSPQQCAFFTRSPKLKAESSLLAGLCSLLGVLPRICTANNRQALINLSRSELLCQAFEVYRELARTRVSASSIWSTWSPLWRAGLTLANCEQCSALTVVDRMSFRAHHCLHCASCVD
jgi:hypothetical protein